MSQDTKTVILAAVKRDGVAPTAKKLGTSRTGLTSYLTGTARDGTSLLIETRAGRLTHPPSQPPHAA
jgi:hypothetical protein